ncbi:alpha/beta fold hydrolase [Altericroceibacterium xinjiangense]|uniref:alpha/beta fold hydrolase n=1 Tax=Altericroceibacterium xinjiangense TaxID=762261 RepID=UPI000F7DDED6|nr:alpha/beta hydrolase [Altericroceibacterium xinjiangense]
MLLLLPGLICDARIFARQLDAFADAKAVDGYGTAGSFEAMARIALDQADKEQPGARFDLLGHSMGARVALEVYRLAPERVRRIALVSTGAHPVGEQEPAKRGGLQRVGHERGFDALLDLWLPPMIGEPNRDKPEIAGPLREMCRSRGQDVFDAQIKALLGRGDQRLVLPTISCPALVMTGELDSWSPPAQHEQIAAMIPNSQLVVVPGAGHMLPVEAPDAMNAAISRWRAAPAND